MSFTVRAHMDASDSSANTDSTFGPDYSSHVLQSLDEFWDSAADISLDKSAALAAATAALQQQQYIPSHHHQQQQQQHASPFLLPPAGSVGMPNSSSAATVTSTPPPPHGGLAPSPHALDLAAAAAAAAAAPTASSLSHWMQHPVPPVMRTNMNTNTNANPPTEKCWVEVHHLAPSTTGVMLMTLFYPHGADEARTIREHGQLLGLVRFRCSEMAARAAEKMNAFFPMGQNQALRVVPVSADDVQAALTRAKLQPVSTLYAALSEDGMNPTRVAMIVESMPYLQAARELSEEVLHADQNILSRITDTIMSMNPQWDCLREFGGELLQRLHLALIETNCSYQSTSCGVVMANLYLHHIAVGDPFRFATNFLQRIGLRVPHVEGVCMLAHICSPMEFKVSKASFWAVVREIACNTDDIAISKALLNHLQRYLRHCSHQDILLPPAAAAAAGNTLPSRPSQVPHPHPHHHTTTHSASSTSSSGSSGGLHQNQNRPARRRSISPPAIITSLAGAAAGPTYHHQAHHHAAAVSNLAACSSAAPGTPNAVLSSLNPNTFSSPTFSTAVWSPPTASTAAAAAAAAAAVEDAKLRTVYISHLPPNLPQNVLMSLLSRCGPVNKVRICAGKGYATLFSFVEMGTIAGAQEVTKLSGFNYLGFNIRVQTAKNPIQDDLKEDAEVSSGGVVRQRCLFGLSSAPLVNAISATDAK